MIRDDNDAAIRFAEKIDSRFPYSDRALASAVISEGWSISLDAAFGALHEICRKPRAEHVTRQRQHELIDEWAARFEHPLKEPLLRCARALTDQQYLPWKDAVSVMKQVAQFKGQYAALNIAYFAGDCGNDEGDTELEAAREHVCKAWSEKSISATVDSSRP